MTMWKKSHFSLFLALALSTLPVGGAAMAAGAAGATSKSEPAAKSGTASQAVTAIAATTAATASNASAAQATADARLAGKAFTQILAGNYYSVALRADGSVWTWGRDLWGELGILKDNNITSVGGPVRLPGLASITAIATNSEGMQVGLRKDGTVWEWGAISGLKQSARDSALPAQVQGLSGVSAVAAIGSAYSQSTGIALTADGKLMTWTHDDATGKAKLSQVSGNYKWSELTSCGGLLFALDASGSAWGFGQKRATDGTATIVQPFKLKGLPAMKQLSAYDSYGQLFGVDRNGGAWSWMASAYYDETMKARMTVKPERLYPQLKVKAIAGGGYPILLTENGEVWYVGKGPTGRSGKVNGLSGIKAIAAGYRHDLALDSQGRVWGFGADKWNETGNLTPATDGMQYKPALVQKAIDVYVDGKLLVAPFPSRLDGGSTSVPMRYALQALGGSWQVSADWTTTYAYGSKTAILRGNEAAQINGVNVTLPAIIPGFSCVTMIPTALLAHMGVQTAWDGKLGELRLTGNAR